jgi:AcrR family transcriptional regulator
VIKKKRKESRIVTRNRKLWLEEAIKTLLEEGPQAVSAKRIAARLGTSRSPFFRVFGSREELIQQMFAFYYQETMVKVIENVRGFTGTPLQRFWYFWIYIIKQEIYRFDRPFRLWSLTDPKINKFVRSMDEERIDFVRQLYEDLGYSKEEADQRASFVYMEYIGILVTGRDEMPKDFLMRRAILRFYLHTTPPMPEDFRLPDITVDKGEDCS